MNAKLREHWVLAVVLAFFLIGVGISITVTIRDMDPVARLVATVKGEYLPHPDDDPIALQINEAGLGNRAAPRILELLDDEDPNIRSRAAEALAQIGADGSLTIRKLLEKRLDPDPSVRYAVLWALARARPTNEDVIDVFLGRTKDNDPETRIDAACTLTYLLPEGNKTLPTILPLLTKALDEARDPSGAVCALGRIGTEARSAIPKLHNMAVTNQSNYRRTEVVTALRKIEGDSDFVISTLIDFLKCDDGFARSYAARTLAEIGPAAKTAIPALEYILDHPPKPRPDSSPATARKTNTSKTYIFPWNAPPITGTVVEMPEEEKYANLREEVLEALKKIRE
ncbi:MAG TPA: HEAT repeat domain-containing protein [Gemmataceae bacterium]|nr:HEAT repeat domain-containing protein [Gemmataceae bacterium]